MAGGIAIGGIQRDKKDKKRDKNIKDAATFISGWEQPTTIL